MAAKVFHTPTSSTWKKRTGSSPSATPTASPSPNGNAWVFAEDLDEDNTTHKLPLFVDSFQLNIVNNKLSVECAIKVSSNKTWLTAETCSASVQMTVVECVTPSPLILECFKVAFRIVCILQVPPVPLPTARWGSMTTLLVHTTTVWMRSQCGKLLFYSAGSKGPKKCISCTQFRDTITCLYQVLMSMVETRERLMATDTSAGARH